MLQQMKVTSATYTGQLLRVVAAGFAVLGATGCTSRTIVITQDDRINTGVHIGRPVEQRTGDPLEVTVVCVYPEDLERDENAGLKPGVGITCKDWYDNRPVRSGGEGANFRLPPEQIYLRTNAAEVYGIRKGPALNGAIEDGRAQIEIRGIKFRPTKLYSRKSVVYVFPKFIGPPPDYEVLPVRAAEFNPPGAYTSKLGVKIGVDEARDNHGQYIDKTSKRGFGRSGKGD